MLLAALQWSAGVSLPAGRGDAAALGTGTGILLFSGTVANQSTVLQLDAATNTWVAAPALDQGRVAAGVGHTGQPGPPSTDGYKYSSDIFVYGGADQGQPTSSVLNYAPTTQGESIAAPAMSTARSAFAYATDPATGDLYAIGGRGASGTPLASAELYDPVADAWSPIAPLPQPLYRAAGASDGAGHIFVFGGDNSAAAPVNSVYRYTIATDTWDAVTQMPVAVADSSALYAAYGLIYVIGGQSAAGAVSNVEAYNPVTDTWAAETPLPAAEYGMAAVIDLSGNVEVIGGINSAGTTVNNVWTSPVGPAPVGLPATPTVAVDPTWYIYDGSAHAATATAVGSDGVTPIDGDFTFTYNGSPTPPTNAGTYKVVAVFTSNDPNYVSSAAKGTLVIDPAAPHLILSGGGTITYDGSAHAVTANALGIDGKTPVNGAFTITYNGLPAAPTTWGVYNVTATFTSNDPNYANATDTTTITIPDPRIPTGLTSTGLSTTSMLLTWNPVTEPDGSVPTYNVYLKVVIHDPRGSGSTIHYSLVAGGLTGTSCTVSRSGVYYVTSVSGATHVESARSAPVSAVPLSAPYLWGAMLGGAVVSSASVQVGGTVQITLLASGNLPPTFSILSGPGTMSVDPKTGVVTYTPGLGEAGTVIATFQASNSVGTSSKTFTFDVLPLPTLIYATGSNNSVTLVQDADQIHIDWALGAVTSKLLINDAAGLTLIGNAGNHPITLDYSKGDPLPATLHLNGTFTLTGLPLNGQADPLAGHLIDLGKSTLFIAYAPGASPLGMIQQYLSNGYGPAGAWTGTSDAITTSFGNADFAIGYADSADGAGINAVPNTIELKYTLAGDTNLDGVVNIADLVALTRNFGKPATWDTGDMNYDGSATQADFLAITRHFGQAMPAPTAAAAAGLTPTVDVTPGPTVLLKRILRKGLRRTAQQPSTERLK